MPSKNTLKIYVEKSYYHIYNRGVNKERIFLDEQDYKTFLSYLKFYLSFPDLRGVSSQVKVAPSKRLKNYADQVKLIAYCLLPNHFHLLIWQNEFDRINFFMRSLATKYSRYFNRKYDRLGPVFQSVYKAVLVESEDQLLYLSKYIHRNPLNLLPTRSLLAGLAGYKYSSYPNYLRLFSQSWVEPLDFINSTYKSFVEETDERDLPTIKSVLIEEI